MKQTAIQLCVQYNRHPGNAIVQGKSTHLKGSNTSVNVVAEGLRRAEEDALVGQLPQVLPIKPLAASCQLLNGILQSGAP